MKDCECLKRLFDDLVVTCDVIEDTSNSVVINPSGGINVWLIAIVLLAITCLLLLVVIVVKYYMKSALTGSAVKENSQSKIVRTTFSMA